MKLKSLIFCAICASLPFASIAYAQENTQILQNAPVDGQMVKLSAKKLWRMAKVPNTQLHHVQKIAQDLTFPSISPEGDRVIMFERGKPGEFNALHEWNAQGQTELMREENVSAYVSWDNSETFSMRERSKPFERDTKHLKFALKNQKSQLKNIQLNHDNNFVVYDADDVIILESKKTKTLQAISDINVDRYYAPVLSPDQRYVAFNGLTSGLHLFDIEANAVVFIAPKATSPAFSPDGKYLIYAITSDDGHQYQTGDLFILNLQNRSYQQIDNPNKEIRLCASLSKNAKFITYQTENNQIFHAELAIE